MYGHMRGLRRLTLGGSQTLVNPTLNYTGANNLDVQYGGTAIGRFWGSGGMTPGALGLWGGLTLRDDGVADQSNATLLLVQHYNDDTPGFALATFNHGIIGSAASDGAAVSIIQDILAAAGAASRAQGRGLNLEVSRAPGVSTNLAVGDKLIEMGVHLGSRLPGSMDSAGTWGYSLGAEADALITKTGIFMINDSADQFGAGVKVYRTGCAIWIGGEDGWDWFQVFSDENQVRVFEVDHRGRTQLRPASFAQVWYFDGASTYTSRTTNAGTSQVGAATTVELPTGASNLVYIGANQTFNSIHIDVATANSYNAPGAGISLEYWNGSAWAAVSSNQPANGSVLTDNTRATSAGGQIGPLVTSGPITFAPPTNWAMASPHATILAGDPNAASRYWIRIGVSAVASTVSGTANMIRPGGINSFEVFTGPTDTTPTISVQGSGRTVIGGAMTVTGATTLSSTLGAGASTLASASVTGAATVGTTLGVTGLTTATGGVKIGSSGASFLKLLTGSVAFDPPSLTNGSVSTATITVTGAAVGDKAIGSLSTLPHANGWLITAYVSQANTVLLTIQNQTGGTVDLASGTASALVIGN